MMNSDERATCTCTYVTKENSNRSIVTGNIANPIGSVPKYVANCVKDGYIRKLSLMCVAISPFT